MIDVHVGAFEILADSLDHFGIEITEWFRHNPSLAEYTSAFAVLLNLAKAH